MIIRKFKGISLVFRLYFFLFLTFQEYLLDTKRNNKKYKYPLSGIERFKKTHPVFFTVKITSTKRIKSISCQLRIINLKLTRICTIRKNSKRTRQQINSMLVIRFNIRKRVELFAIFEKLVLIIFRILRILTDYMDNQNSVHF